MKKLIILFSTLFFTVSAAFAAQPADAEAFAEKLADEIMADVVKPAKTLEQRQDAFRRIFLSAINIKTSARFTLGRFARTTGPEQLKAYETALTDNIVRTWAGRFADYGGETIRFEGARKSEKGDFYVTSKIDIPNTENDVEVVWRVTDKKDELKLADLIVEGVSMLMSYRNEYAAILQQNGGDVADLTRKLNDKNDALAAPVAKAGAKKQ